jgi:hypothetical protein
MEYGSFSYNTEMHGGFHRDTRRILKFFCHELHEFSQISKTESKVFKINL